MVYYTGSDGLALYREPGRDVVIRLPLHQKVLRYRLERGYAYVRVEGTGQEGWLENSQLIWRLPRQPTAVQPPGSPPAAGVETTTVPEVSEPVPPAQPSDEATSTAPEEQPSEEIPPDKLPADELPPPDEVPADEEPAQAPAGTPGSVSPSVFEPF